MTMENPLIFYRKFIVLNHGGFSRLPCDHVIVFQVATDFWDSILNLYFWNFLATVIKKLLYCFFWCVFVNAQILLKEVDPENLFRSGESTESKKSFRKTQEDAWLWWWRQERRGDGPRFVSRWHEDLLVPCCEFSSFSKAYVSCRYHVPWQTLLDIFISKEQV